MRVKFGLRAGLFLLGLGFVLGFVVELALRSVLARFGLLIYLADTLWILPCTLTCSFPGTRWSSR